MDRIGVRELRQHASRYIARVKDGETIEVTDRGRLVAVLAPPSPASSARERLIAEGVLLPRTSERPALPARVSSDLDSAAVLDDLRGDR